MIMKCSTAELALEALIYMVMMEETAMVMELTLLL